jgi:glycosyltransferase involved in cell wall biosynthesis
MPEVIGDAGFLFRPGEREGLLEKLMKLLKHESLRIEMGRKGRARVLKSYDVPIVAEKIANEILSTLER